MLGHGKLYKYRPKKVLGQELNPVYRQSTRRWLLSHRNCGRLQVLFARPAVDFTSVAFTRWRQPHDTTHPIQPYYSFINPMDERLSWPGWLTCSGRFTHNCGHQSAAGRAWDRESLPTRDRRSTTVPRNQLYRK